MKRVMIILSMISILLTSCNKDNSETAVTPIPQKDYMQLKVGNYWVYDKYHIDADGNENLSQHKDSVVIIGDTMINDIQYFKQHLIGQSHVVYLRDSSGFLINLEGEVLFSSTDFSNVIRVDTIGNGLAFITYKMEESDTLITVPMGNYPCITFKGTVTALDPNYPHGVQYTYYFYADGFGQVKSSNYFLSNPMLRVERRLSQFGNLGE